MTDLHFWRAHTNIALIKYWGKADEQLIIPMNNSLSLTLDAFYTDTAVCFDANQTADELILNGQTQSEASTKKVSRFLDHFRKLADTDLRAKVISINHVPTAAGLASSASAFAALAAASRDALNLDMDERTLSTMARLGSGSASRSIYGGFVEWIKGADHQSSVAVPFDDGNWDIGMIAIVNDHHAKKISSREGMKRTVETSDFYAAWPTIAQKDLEAIKPAIKTHDLDALGAIAEHNALAMHATTLTASPSFTYLNAETWRAIHVVERLREASWSVYLTMDAGPNVKVICRQSEMKQIMALLEEDFATDRLIPSTVGAGVQPAPISASEGLATCP